MTNKGIFIAILILLFWITNLVYSLLYVEVDFLSPFLYLHVITQAYLYTGLFITAHDAMHGTVSKFKKLNFAIGWICTFLFAGLSYSKLICNHRKHHENPGSIDDPDYCTKSQNFFYWFFSFFSKYVTIGQIIFMALIFNLMKLFTSELSIWFFFVLPVILSSFQLFFFGTYLPHKLPHEQNMKPHNARTQKKNNIIAMITCYFFGYHYEHHEFPYLPWWKLYSVK